MSITALDLKNRIDKELEILKGKNTQKDIILYKEGEKIINKIASDISIINLTVNGLIVYIYSSSLNHNLKLGNIKVTYKTDKRMHDRKGYIIEDIQFVYKTDVPDKNIPDNLNIGNISQKLSYDYAKMHVNRLKEEIKELEEEIIDRKEAIKDLEGIMEIEKYF